MLLCFCTDLTACERGDMALTVHRRLRVRGLWCAICGKDGWHAIERWIRPARAGVWPFCHCCTRAHMPVLTSPLVPQRNGTYFDFSCTLTAQIYTRRGYSNTRRRTHAPGNGTETRSLRAQLVIFIKTTTVKRLNIKTCLKCCFGAANDRVAVPLCQAARLQLCM